MDLFNRPYYQKVCAVSISYSLKTYYLYAPKLYFACLRNLLIGIEGGRLNNAVIHAEQLRARKYRDNPTVR